MSVFSRRKFFKTSALSSSIILGSAVLPSCSQSKQTVNKGDLPFHRLPVTEGTVGLLFSQIGYEKGLPVRIVIRVSKKEYLQDSAQCLLHPVANEKSYKAPCQYWGEIWGSHWWVAEFSNISETGQWNIEVTNNGEVILADQGLKVGNNILWNTTLELAAVDMLERRVHFTKVGAGWQDAGTLWVESPAQSAMVISLCELLTLHGKVMDSALKGRIEKQITVGCDYLVMTQDKARELGYPEGSFSHDLLGHEKDVLPNDAVKAVIALTKASGLLSGNFKSNSGKYKAAASKAYNWLITDAKPVGDLGLSRFQRGMAAGTPIPIEWQTRDLVSLCWASLEQWKAGNKAAKEEAIKYAVQIMDRQIPKDKAESGFYGHFVEYPSMPHSEKSWIHGIVNNTFGADIGGIYPNYLVPFIEMIKLWPDMKEAETIKTCLHNFTYGYLIPACEKNPFYLVPQGIFGKEGPIWFCGTFHGTNTIYGYTAALAMDLADFFSESKLKAIAYGNLQWLAGLNAGITTESIKEGCVVFSTDIPLGMALPASMMCGVGNRWAGTWFQTRGVICNGFTTGKQFVYDVEPKKENDGPFSFTDEDWIPHTAGWLTGLIRLNNAN